MYTYISFLHFTKVSLKVLIIDDYDLFLEMDFSCAFLIFYYYKTLTTFLDEPLFLIKL